MKNENDKERNELEKAMMDILSNKLITQFGGTITYVSLGASNYIHLKTKEGDFNSKKFAILLEPVTVEIHSDEDLYAAVRKYGKAVIQPMEHMMKHGDVQSLTPEQFEETWIGD